MKTDLQKTKHYTTNYEFICRGLFDKLPGFGCDPLIEPFVGGGDLINLFPEGNWQMYDIDEDIECIHQDTLLFPPNYEGMTVVTNPPFLAKNHATDKILFAKYGYDDLYKIFLKTIIGCKQGMVIVPGNFFCDEGSAKIRQEFLSQYQVSRVNFFTYPVFETTSYSVCAFSFYSCPNTHQLVPFYINDSDTPFLFDLDKQYNYQIAGDVLSKIQKESSIFSRLVAGKEPKNPTNIYLYAADTSKDKIRLEIRPDQYYGKPTDRMFATLDCGRPQTLIQQKWLVDHVNEWLTDFRSKYANLPFTNYRDNNRKRVGFDFIYKLCSYVLRTEDYELRKN